MNCEAEENGQSFPTNEELISILVPLYNVGPFVQKCAESLLSQTYEHLEFIFVNDASTDNTLIVLQQAMDKFPERSPFVKLINNSKNLGLSAVRNIALSHASGKYIFFIDGDDFLEIDAIALLHKKKQSTGADIVVGDFLTEYKNYKLTYKHQNDLTKEKYFFGIIQRSIPCCIWGKLIKKDLFLQNQIKGIEKVQFGEDFGLTTRLIYQAQKIAFLNSPIYHYIRTNQQSITKNLNARSVEDLLCINNILFNYFGENQEINNQLKLHTKLLLLKQLPSVELLNMASKIYPELTVSIPLKFRDKIILKLAKMSYFKLLLNLDRAYIKLMSVRHIIFRK